MVSMKKYDFCRHYNFCESKQIVFSYNGKISANILQGIITILEDRLTDHNVKKSRARKIISIIIELSQNIQHYSFHKPINQGDEHGYGILVVRKVEEGFQINTGNLLSQEKADEFIRYCNQFIKLNQKPLKDMYLKKLKANRETASDRTGIGLLYILRKSNSQMEIKSHRIDKTNVLLTISVLVN